MTGVRLDDSPYPPAVPAGEDDQPARPAILARRTFAGLPNQVTAARRWLAQLIDGYAAADEILLACSELAANAVLHSDSGLPRGTFTVRLAINPEYVRVEVLDQGGPWNSWREGADELCERQPDTSQRGRGLDIVAAVTSAWGVTGDDEGRTAWCEFEAE
jgi:anti-sigma regulatory factor (Ser/Thr protein kinase)